MRRDKALKNILTSIISYALLFGVGLLIRRLLLDSFDSELVGYDGLISDIFSFIALADIGSNGMFTYRLFESIAKNDDKRTIKLISMYRKMFIVFGTTILFICIIVYILLPYIFVNKVTHWNLFNKMFILYTVYSVITYYFGYWRPVLVAEQLEYKAIRIETFMSLISMAAKIVVLLTSKDYLIYLLLTTGCNCLSVFLVFIISKKQYNNINYTKVTINDFKDEGMDKECLDLFVIKIADTITWCSTNLFSTLLINIQSATYYYNYSIIGSTIWNLITKITKPLTASVADMMYKEDKEDSYGFFNTLSLCFFFIASILMCGFFNVFQPTIAFIFGDKYLLSSDFLLAYSIQFYITTRSDFCACFRNCTGNFEIEKKYSMIGLIFNLILSIALSKFIGIAGIVIGTISSIFVTWICRIYVVEKVFYNKNLLISFKREIILFIIALVELAITFSVTTNIEYNFFGIVYCSLLSVLIPIVINIVIYGRTIQFKQIINIFKDIMINIRNKKNA